MTLLLFNGFETPRVNFFPTAGTTYVAGRTGKCLNIPQGGDSVSFPMSNVTSFKMGFAWKRGVRTNASGAAHTIIEFTDATDYSWAIVHDYDSGIVSVTRTQGLSTVVPLGAASIPLAIDVWAYIEIDCVMSDTVGVIELRFDGNVVFRFDGDTMRWTAGLAACEWKSSSYSLAQIDDFYILDGVDATATQGRPFNDYLGAIRIEALRPTAAGASTQWLGSDGNSVDNHLLVDDPDQPDTADYIASSTTADRDLYEFADPSFAGVVLAVDVLSHCSAPEGGSPLIKSVVRDPGGTVTVGPGTTPAVAWATRTDTIHAKDPLGELWTTGKVAAAQFGVEMETA